MSNIIVLNLKAYPEVFDKGGTNMLDACKAASADGVPLWVSPPASLIRPALAREAFPVMFQATHRAGQGSQTGWVTPMEVQASGATGAILNHAENPMSLRDLASVNTKLKELGLKTIICTSDLASTKAAAAMAPDYVAIEPPDLIGGDISVTTADPKIVSDAVAAVKLIDPKVGVLTGAGVKNGADVAMAIELGCQGVLLASGVVKAADPAAALRELASGLPKT